MRDVRQGWILLNEKHGATASQRGTFILSGYPSARVRLDGSQLTGSLLTGFTERIAVPRDAEEPVDERLDLFLRYADKANDVKGKEISLPKLFGMSGSSVWEYSEVPNQIWTPEAAVRVTGIQSAYREGQYVRVKSWSFVQNMLSRLVKDSR